ncbi:MAG TPA: serine/threonine-protein kinase [Gemmataceae bacterium]|nr:serine/threonine-protein kinase [Gemmataceae bacterium]
MLDDAANLGQRIVRLGLVTDEIMREALFELGPAAPAPMLLAELERKQHLTDWQAAKLQKGDFDGLMLGGYRVLYKIASGSFGRVFRADDPRTGAAVAIKVLRRRWCEDPHKVDLFEREGKVGLTLRHPNIVQILAVQCDRRNGQHFIVMEFVEGGNLRDILAIRKIELVEAIRILEESASALAYAYSRGLTHRDLKPSNILLSSQRVSKLVDFGLAEIAAGMSLADDEDTAVDRTVDYAGLEKATNVASGDVRSDIFFMGTILYEMLSGKPALPPTRDRRARMQKQRFEKLPVLSREEVNAPNSVFQLLDHMMVLDPQLRYQTPSQMLDAVRQVQQEVSGGPAAIENVLAEGSKTVFVVEKKPKFQDVIRDKLKAMGFKVMMSIDASRALLRYQQQPFHAIVIDAATSGEEALETYRGIQREADKQQAPLAVVLILDEEQAHWRNRISETERLAILTFPVKKGLLESTLARLLKIDAP